MAKAKGSTSGLVPDDVKLLEGCLRDVGRALTRDFLLGGSVASPLREVERELRNRLSPPDPEALAAKAERLLKPARDCYWMKDGDPIQTAVAEVIG
jgi:hypothetical protein